MLHKGQRLALSAIGTIKCHICNGSDEVKTVKADDAAVVLTVQDTSYRAGD
jgi:hypothetical protein